MYKNIILDFNGTLLDDCDVCLKILNFLCAEYNLKSVSKEFYKSIFTFPVSNYYKICGFDIDNGNFEIIGNKFHAYYNKLSYDEAFLFNDVKDTLKALKENGYRLICLSASKQETLIKQLKYYGIDEDFDDVVGLSDTNAVSKVQAAIDFMKNNNINPSECMFVGDSIHDFEVASEIKTDCYLVATGHTNKDRLLKETNKVIDRLSDILCILK